MYISRNFTASSVSAVKNAQLYNTSGPQPEESGKTVGIIKQNFQNYQKLLAKKVKITRAIQLPYSPSSARECFGRFLIK